MKGIVAAQEEVYGYAKQSAATRNPTGGQTSTSVTTMARVPAPPSQPSRAPGEHRMTTTAHGGS